MNRNLLIAGLVVAIAAAIGFLAKRTHEQSRSADFPEGMHWLCQSCGYGFSTSRDEFAKWVEDHPGRTPECPRCHKMTTVVARHCPLPDCGKYYTQVNVVLNGKVCCPICRQPLP